MEILHIMKGPKGPKEISEDLFEQDGFSIVLKQDHWGTLRHFFVLKWLKGTKCSIYIILTKWKRERNKSQRTHFLEKIYETGGWGLLVVIREVGKEPR